MAWYGVQGVWTRCGFRGLGVGVGCRGLRQPDSHHTSSCGNVLSTPGHTILNGVLACADSKHMWTRRGTRKVDIGYLEKGIQTPMARGRSTKIISMMKWIRTSRLSLQNSLSVGNVLSALVSQNASIKWFL
jgi:hypothetical protein